MTTATVVPANGTAQQIVKLDQTPPVRLTGVGRTVTIVGSALAPINMPVGNFLPLVRIPTNAIVQKVEICLDTAPSTSLTGSIGFCFSDGNDGTDAANKSTYALTSAAPTIVSSAFFFFQAAITSYVGLWTDVTFQNSTGNSVTDGFYVPSASKLPLWQATQGSLDGVALLGKATAGAGTSGGGGPSGQSGNAFVSCTSDPGGFFDVTWFETSTGVNTAAVTINVRVTYIETAAN